MVSETAAKAVAEEENISVRKSSSSATGYFKCKKRPGAGRFQAFKWPRGSRRQISLGNYDSAYEAAVARGMDADEVEATFAASGRRVGKKRGRPPGSKISRTRRSRARACCQAWRWWRQAQTRGWRGRRQKAESSRRCARRRRRASLEE